MSNNNWEEIGTAIGSTDSYGFLLTSLKGSLGDIVITETEILQKEVQKSFYLGQNSFNG